MKLLAFPSSLFTQNIDGRLLRPVIFQEYERFLVLVFTRIVKRSLYQVPLKKSRTQQKRNTGDKRKTNALAAVLAYSVGLPYEYALSSSFLTIYCTLRRSLPLNLQPSTF